MNQGTYIGLIYNAALLLALGIIFDSITLRNQRNTLWAKFLTGISLGAVALAIMINPWVLKPGVVFDTRSILLSVTAMFFGILPTAIATVMALSYRIWQGGAGIYMGCAVIIASVFWGYIWKKQHSKWKNPYGFGELYLLGISNHVTMLALTILLPESIRYKVFSNIAIPVLMIYPLATVLLGQILARRVQRRREKFELIESEKQFRSLYDNAPMAYQSLDEDGNFITVNKAWLQSLGYCEEEILGRNFADILHPDYREHFAFNFPKFKKAGHIEGVEFVFLKKDGSEMLVSFNGKIVRQENGSFKQTQCVFTDITERRKQEAALRGIEWMLTKQHVETDSISSYGDLTELNTNRLILDTVGKDTLRELVGDYLSLLDTSSAVYERNGDYAMGIFSSSWCQYLDTLSRRLCNTDSNAEALRSGKWLCHESCWTDVSRKVIETGEPVDLKCNGGIYLYAIPIKTSEGIVGAINMGYGSPPTDETKLQEIADKYSVDLNEIKQKALEYNSRPAFIIAQAKRKLHTAARIIGEIVERKQAENQLEKVSIRQQAILSSVPDIIMQVDKDKIYTWANQAGFDFFGEDVIGKEAKDFFVREQDTYDVVQPLFNGDEQVVYVESWQRRKDGVERLLAWWCKVLRDANGEVAGALSSAWDVTDQRIMQEELNNYFSNALDLFCIADTEGYFRRLNKSWEQTLGLKIEDLENVKFLDFVHPDDLPATLEAISKLANQQEIVKFINRYRHKDGSYRWIEWRSYPAGKRIYAAARDITEIKNANDELIKIKQEWETIFQSIPHATYLMDKDQNILAANKYSEIALGMTFEQMKGKKCWELMHGSDAHEPPPGCPFSQSCSEERSEMEEMEVQALDGYYMVSCKPIYDSSGKLERVLHIAMDITERKKAEIILAESEEKYRVLTETAKDLIIVHQLDGSVSYANPVALEFLGIDSTKLPEINIWSYIAPEYHPMLKQNLKERDAGFLGSRMYQIELFDQFNKKRMVEVSSSPIVSGKKVTGILAIMRDITERLADQIAVRESEERYRSLVESSDSVIAMFDELGVIRFANGKAAQTLNLREEEMVGKSMSDIFPLEVAEYQFGLIQQVIQSGNSITVESCSSILGKDLWYHTSICPVMSISGKPKLAVINATDITKIKEADLALQASEEKFRRLIETANEGICIMNREFITTFVNKRLVEMVGYAEEELIGFHVSSFMPQSELPDHNQKLNDRSKGFDDHYERRIVTKEGKNLWVMISAKAVFDDKGKFDGAFVMVTDITHIKQTQQALYESERKYRNIFETTLEGVYQTTPEGKYISVNPAFARMLGYDTPEQLMTSITNIGDQLYVIPENRLELKTLLLENQVVTNFETQLYRKDKSIIWVLINSAVITTDNGEIQYYQGGMIDITARKSMENALKESQRRFEMFMEYFPGGAFISDSNSKALFVNKYLLNVFGPKGGVGSTPLEAFPPDLGPSIIADDKMALEQGYRHGEQTVPHQDGSVHIYDSIKFAIKRESADDLLGGIILDVTDRKKAEIALLESQSRFEQFMNHIPGNVFIKDSNGKFLYVNKHMVDAFGADSWLGKTPLEVLQKDEAWDVIANDQEVLATGIMQMVDSKKDELGNLHYYETTKFPITRTGQDKMIGGLSLDVTTKIKAEEEKNRYAHRLEILHQIDSDILESNSLEQIMESSLKHLHRLIPCNRCSISAWECNRDDWYIIVLDDINKSTIRRESVKQIPVEFETELSAGKTIYIPDVNQTEREISDFRKQLVESGLICFLHIPLVMQGEYYGSINFASKTKNDFSEEQILTVSEIAIQMTIAIQQMHLTHAIVRHSDEMELKVEERTEQLKNANKELETFSYTVAHDLRSPLRSIDGFSTILLEDYAGKLDNDGIELLKVIKHNTLKMDTLIKELLELAKLNPYSIKLKHLQMEALVNGVINEELPEETIAMFDIQIDELQNATGDKKLIRQVWLNLISNAVKFTVPKQEKTIHIGCYRQEESIVYFIKDSGVGFDMKYIDKIFGPFQRLHRIADFEGTGIGLAIVKKIVQRHNGEVWAESELGKGSTFYFSLPAEPV